MDRMELASILLSHIGGPSMLVTGKKSALPAGDRVGILLNSISPSLAAKLARKAIPHRREIPDAAGRHGSLSPAQLLRRKQNAPAATAARGRLGLRPVPWWLLAGHASVHRSTPIRPCSAAEPANPTTPGTQSPAVPDAPHRPPLGWPWDRPAPVQPPSPPPAARCGQGGVGLLLDVIA